MYVPHNWRVIAMTLGHTIAVSKSTLSHSSRILDSSFICYWNRSMGEPILYAVHALQGYSAAGWDDLLLLPKIEAVEILLH